MVDPLLQQSLVLRVHWILGQLKEVSLLLLELLDPCFIFVKHQLGQLINISLGNGSPDFRMLACDFSQSVLIILEFLNQPLCLALEFLCLAVVELVPSITDRFDFLIELLDYIGNASEFRLRLRFWNRPNDEVNHRSFVYSLTGESITVQKWISFEEELYLMPWNLSLRH